jgi:hypothetical protein
MGSIVTYIGDGVEFLAHGYYSYLSDAVEL